MFVTKAWSQMKDREVGGQRKSSHSALNTGQESWVMGWSVCQKTVMSEGLFVLVHSPQILSFPSAQTQGGSDFFTRTWSTLPASFPLPWAKPQLHSPKRLSRDCVWL